MARKPIGELLLESGIIDEFHLRAALAEQKKWDRPLGQVLVEMGAVTEETMVNVLSHQLNIPTIGLEGRPIDQLALDQMDIESCRRLGCIPFKFDIRGKFLDVAMSDPTNPVVFDEIRVKTQCNIRPYLAGRTAIEAAIHRAYLGKDIEPGGISRWQSPAPIAEERLIDFEAPAQPAPQKAEKQNTQRDPSYLTKALGQVGPVPPPIPQGEKEISSIQTEIAHLRAMIERDEKVLRKLMGLLVKKGVFTKEELAARLKEE